MVGQCQLHQRVIRSGSAVLWSRDNKRAEKGKIVDFSTSSGTRLLVLLPRMGASRSIPGSPAATSATGPAHRVPAVRARGRRVGDLLAAGRAGERHGCSLSLASALVGGRHQTSDCFSLARLADFVVCRTTEFTGGAATGTLNSQKPPRPPRPVQRMARPDLLSFRCCRSFPPERPVRG